MEAIKPTNKLIIKQTKQRAQGCGDKTRGVEKAPASPDSGDGRAGAAQPCVLEAQGSLGPLLGPQTFDNYMFLRKCLLNKKSNGLHLRECLLTDKYGTRMREGLLESIVVQKTKSPP